MAGGVDAPLPLFGEGQSEKSFKTIRMISFLNKIRFVINLPLIEY